MRYLPETTSICSIIVRIYNLSHEKLYKPSNGYPNLDSSVISPTFNFKMTLAQSS